MSDEADVARELGRMAQATETLGDSVKDLTAAHADHLRQYAADRTDQAVKYTKLSGDVTAIKKTLENGRGFSRKAVGGAGISGVMLTWVYHFFTGRGTG